ncbi:MAG TPA: precorrin-3B synthase, partial [Xanthobacteraceae bacterium]|nr:precorrin-3B synthase [Xanthobacteraceae bacterium]
CAAARQHGNGIVEITARGNIQVRGLSASSAPRFAAAIAALGIAAADGIPVLSDPLAGLDPEELIDTGALAADLRQALAQSSLATRLGAKVSVAIDGGGLLTLDAVAADVRLRAERMDGGGIALVISIGGDATSAAQLGAIAPGDGVEAAMRLLDVIARLGRGARARDIVVAEGTTVFRSVVADLPIGDAAPRPARLASEAVGVHRLRDGQSAYGIGLAFGHADATSLQRLVDAAKAAAAIGLRAVPDRVLMIVGLTRQTLSSFVALAENLGFIVRADDPRRNVVACAGAPLCGSAHIATRAIAPRIADAAAPHGDGFKIHMSGCTKGCAHPASASLTVVGTSDGCALIANGSARDTPFAVIPANELPAAIARYLRERKHENSHV